MSIFPRRFRIVAIDHDLLSFGDFTFGEWPLVVVTNPKDAHYIPAREQWQRMAHSTHIRILAFSLDPIQSVHVSIDDGLVSARADHADGPLYTLLWSPMQFEPGLHKIVVEITVCLAVLFLSFYLTSSGRIWSSFSQNADVFLGWY